jgi:hypothetical protein
VRQHNPWWSVEVPPTWQASRDAVCTTLTAEPPVGALQISAARKMERKPTDADLRQIARQRSSAGTPLETVRLGDVTGFAVQYSKDGEHWREWYLRAGPTVLFVTYTCDERERGTEDAAVDQALSSLTSEL